MHEYETTNESYRRWTYETEIFTESETKYM